MEEQEVSAGVKTAANIVKTMYENDLANVLPVFYKACCTLATISATSCSAERSFSGLRRLKPYVRSTMHQARHTNIAIINIERAYANNSITISEVTDIFGRRNGRHDYFFWSSENINVDRKNTTQQYRQDVHVLS